MGTSTSSEGPKGGAPYDPDWLDDECKEINGPLKQNPDNSSQPEEDHEQTGEEQHEPDEDFANSEQDDSEEESTRQQEFAPAQRFKMARQNLRGFIRSGNKKQLEKALGYYSHKGMGGASKLAERMRVSTHAGSQFFGLLNEIQNPTDEDIIEWLNQLASKELSQSEIANEIIEKLISSGGSFGLESVKKSMAVAMTELIKMNPDVNLLNMDNDSIWIVLELFMTEEITNRLISDIGPIFENENCPITQSTIRFNEMQDYLRSEVSAQFHELTNRETKPTNSDLNRILQTVIEKTFKVFEVSL